MSARIADASKTTSGISLAPHRLSPREEVIDEAALAAAHLANERPRLVHRRIETDDPEPAILELREDPIARLCLQGILELRWKRQAAIRPNAQPEDAGTSAVDFAGVRGIGF